MHAAIPELIFARANSISAPRNTADNIVDVWRGYQGNVYAHVISEGECLWIDVRGIACYGFRPDTGAVLVTGIACSTDLVQEVYWRYVLPAILYSRGREVLHASAVVFPEGVCALCGDSENGKSTLAHGLTRRGYPLFADDAVAFEPTGDSVLALPLPFRMRLRPPSAQFFQEQSLLLEPRPTGYVVPPGEVPPRLAMLLLLERSHSMPADAPVSVAPASTGDAFVAVLHHAYMTCPDEARKQRMIRQYMELCRHVPIVHVRFQSGLEHLESTLLAIERAIERA